MHRFVWASLSLVAAARPAHALPRPNATGINGLCAPTDNHDDCSALVALWAATRLGPNKLPWADGTPVCTWRYCACDNRTKRVTKVAIPPMDFLDGSIPPEIGKLSFLTDLGLSALPSLSGSIPPEIGELSSLELLNIGGNRISGSIPSEIGKLSSLKRLYLNNMKLNDTIPPVIMQLSSLLALDLSSNPSLTGAIPPEIGQLSSLDLLNLNDNNLTGLVPLQLCNITDQLDLCSLEDNAFKCPLPACAVADCHATCK